MLTVVYTSSVTQLVFKKELSHLSEGQYSLKHVQDIKYLIKLPTVCTKSPITLRIISLRIKNHFLVLEQFDNHNESETWLGRTFQHGPCFVGEYEVGDRLLKVAASHTDSADPRHPAQGVRAATRVHGQHLKAPVHVPER